MPVERTLALTNHRPQSLPGGLLLCDQHHCGHDVCDAAWELVGCFVKDREHGRAMLLDRSDVGCRFPAPSQIVMYGRTYLGTERTTFAIGSDGVITHVFRKVKPAEHDAQVLAALAE